MKFDRPILCCDFETTGVDPVLDRIISMGVSILHPDGEIKPNGWEIMFNPGIQIPEGATAIHGITDADVADCPPFSDYAAKLHKSLQGKDILTYNGRRLDLPILDSELRRCGLKLDLKGVRILDAQTIFFKKKPRSLADAVEEYCGRVHAESHGAGPDAAATLDVLLGQMKRYPDLDELSLDDLHKYSLMGEFEPADLSGKLYRDQKGYLRFAFGKWKDERVLDQSGYAGWMLGKDFPEDTKECLREELEGTATEPPLGQYEGQS